jgi:putative addiction module component (TIGR02574 family)
VPPDRSTTGLPELEKLSTAEKFALAVELWDELSSNPDEVPITEEQLNELNRGFEEYRQIRIKSLPRKSRGKDTFPLR